MRYVRARKFDQVVRHKRNPQAVVIKHYRGVITGKYMPHQGAQEMARRAAR